MSHGLYSSNVKGFRRGIVALRRRPANRREALVVKLSLEEFETLVDRALDSIPPEFESYMEGLAVDIEPMPDEQTLRDLGLGDPRELLGLYRGTPLTNRSVEQSLRMPDSIVIYQRSIERLCKNRAQIVRQIRKTVLHEVGHHFGLNEEQLGELGYQ
jgi:predicted Zn-dependent protease with MMP-like domain